MAVGGREVLWFMVVRPIDATWEFDLRELLMNLRHSVRDHVLRQMPCVGRLGGLREVRRASRSRTGGGRLLLFVLRLSESQHGPRHHRLGFEELDVLGG